MSYLCVLNEDIHRERFETGQQCNLEARQCVVEFGHGRSGNPGEVQRDEFGSW
jgi:hypothetical protein